MKRGAIILIAVVVLGAAGAFAYSWWNGRASGISASGTLEARNISVGSKVGGRVTKVLVREGDRVEANQLLITFDDAELAAQLTQSRGRLSQAQAALLKLQHGSRPEEIAQARAAAATDANAPGYRLEEIAQLEADLQRAKVDQRNAEQTYQRTSSLADQGILPSQARDDAQARLDAAKAQVRSLENSVTASRARLREAQAQKDMVERGPRREDIDAARADVVRAQGELAQAEARWAEREVRSPSAAMVEVLDLRPGDLVTANAPVAKLLEANQLYAMVYVPQNDVGRVRVGQHAEVRVDAFGKRAFTATVEQIRQQAEFLPRNVQTAEERQHQVFGVKLRVENPGNELRAGVQADVVFTEAK
jgi:multidrug resistance efflux pump